MIEYSITIKDSNATFIDKDTTLEKLILDPHNETIQALVKQALAKLKIDHNLEAPEIVFKAKLIIQS